MGKTFQTHFLFHIVVFTAFACSPVDTGTAVIFDTSSANSENANFDPLEANPNGDADGDGLSNKEELECGSDPELQDTDGDGLEDQAECETHMTDPANVDTDGDLFSDFEELFTHQPATDPLNPDDDQDGYVPVDDLPGWPTVADCAPFDAQVFPGNLGPQGLGDQVDGVDIDCQVDVTAASFTCNKGYTVEASLAAGQNAVFVKAYTLAPPVGGVDIGCNKQHHTGENNGECRVDPFDLGCNGNTSCIASGDDQQPFTDSHTCHTWNENIHHKRDFDTCQVDFTPGGIGFKVEKIHDEAFQITVVGKANNSASNPPPWCEKKLLLGE